MCHFLLTSAIAGSLLPGFTPLSAQEAPGTLKVQSQLVVLDVVVTDKAGNLVSNLNRDDFEVLENGVLRRFARSMLLTRWIRFP